MASSQDPHDITDAPPAILELAKRDPRITINLRPDRWPKELIAEANTDIAWRLCQMEHGLFMYPGFTEFLTKIEPDAALVISYQSVDASQIFTCTDMVREIYWIGHPSNRGRRGVHVDIRLVGPIRRDRREPSFDQVWGNFVLAIAEVPAPVRHHKRADLDGALFVELYTQLMSSAPVG